MPNHKSARHHWWPECVSEHWADADGFVNWLRPTGEIAQIPPAKLGAITNGHMIKLGRVRGEQTPWDQNFEHEFDKADNAFPDVIQWLTGLENIEHADGTILKDRFLPQTVSDECLTTLTECVISLAVRSPMNRATAISVAEHFRGSVRGLERNAIIGLNIRRTQRTASDSIGARAKFLVIYSPIREFIFGDGFFSNLRSPLNGMFLPRILAPLTPNIAVLITRPIAYNPEPRLVTIMASPTEIDRLNEAVQVYASDFIFFRADRPEITEHFRLGEHRIYDGPNTVDNLIQAIPGVGPYTSPFGIVTRSGNR